MDDLLIDMAPDCLVVMDLTGKVFKANKKAVSFFGNKIKEGLKLSELPFYNSVKENIFKEDYIKSYFEFNFENRELTYRGEEGYLFHFLLSSSKIVIHEKNYFFLSFKNITDFISYRNIFEELYNSLSTKTIELDNVLSEKERTYKLLKMKDDEMLRQLNLAKEVQRGLFPELNRTSKNYQISTKMLPASTISGDMIVFNERSENIIDIIMADVTGHGIPAALITMLLKMSLQAASSRFDDPIYILDLVNKDMHTVLSSSAIFATLLYTRINLATGEILSVNCGHPSPIILRADGRIEKDEIGGMLLGVVENLDFNIYNLKISKGDSLILITDGLTEASDEKDIFFEDKFIDFISKNPELNPDAVINESIARLHKHTGKPELQDDISIVCIKKT